MDKKSLGHHLGIQPLFVIMAAGMTFVAAYTIRLATRTTDIQWVKNDVCMNDNLRDKQFQMLNPAGHDLAGAGKKLGLAGEIEPGEIQLVAVVRQVAVGHRALFEGG